MLKNDTIYDIIIKGQKHIKEKKMPQIYKIIEKMKRQPNGIRFEELKKVLEYKGYIMKNKTRNIT